MRRLFFLAVYCSMVLAFSACDSSGTEQRDEATAAAGEEVVAKPNRKPPTTKTAEDEGPLVEEEKPATSTGKLSTNKIEPTAPTISTGKPAPSPSVAVRSKKEGTSRREERSETEQKISGDSEVARNNDTDKSSLDNITSPTKKIDLNKGPNLNKPDHGIWTEQLARFVSAQGQVDYAAWKRDEEKLDVYLKELSDNFIAEDWSRNEQMAYWINAYNAFTVKLILNNYPVQKITNLHGGKPWDVKWIELANKTYSLNQIENDILRPKYGDARIHFAVNCAAVSCPPLMNKAYTSGNLNRSLATNAQAFINNSRYNTIETSSAEVSKIFDWYKSDFGDLTEYLNQYAKTKLAADATISFKEYDWSLNGK